MAEQTCVAQAMTTVHGDDVMSDELDQTCKLRALATQLGGHDWRAVMEAAKGLPRAGRAGIDAVLWGLTHLNPRVRRGCAGFLDHHGTDACFAKLRWVALHDPAAKVRRVAVHSVTCQRCKPSPLTGDLVGLLVEAALADRNRRVREKAIGGLGSQPRDARAVEALQQILHGETDPRLRRAAHRALKGQDPSYKAAIDAQTREKGIAAAARARKGQQMLRAPTE